MNYSATALLNEEDTQLVMDCSADFLITAVKAGRLEVIHINGDHFFALEQMLEVKREMSAQYADFEADIMSAERASEITPAYF